MNIRYHLKEDKIAKKIPIMFSSEVEDFIDDIDFHNRFNENELIQFYCGLEGVLLWLSNTSIAWDNSNNFNHLSNGTTYFERFGFNMTYTIKVNETTNLSFVYILTLRFNLEDYGLKIPYYITENNNTKLCSMKKSLIRLTEGDLCHIVKNCINEILLIENRESKSIKQTEKIIVSLFQNTYGDRLFQTVTDNQGQPILTQRGDEQTMLQYLERHVRATFFHNDYANIKFEPGIARIAYGELGMQANEDQQSLHKLGGILKILSQAHSDEYDSNFNGMSFTDLDNRFGKLVSDIGKEEQDRINNAEYNGNGDYTIVKINSFEEAKPFYKYTNPKSRWCLTHMKNMFDRYTNNGSNTLYFAYKKGFENIEPIKGEGCPLDEYGLSLLSIIMTSDCGDGGSLAYCTCRWNHGNGGSDSVMDAQELSNVLGGSVFKLCPPRKIEINIDGDLGMPSGTIWMTKNVGAKSETDYGKYFAWGMKQGFYTNEIDYDMFGDEWYEQQEIVNWSNFRFEDGSYAPSKEQLNELKENCTYNFTKYKGVNGGLFTSKINGNSIFVPAAGCCDFDSQYYVGEDVYLWSSSLNESDSNNAWFLHVYSDGVYLNDYYRFDGFSVRGVVSSSK